MPAAHRLVLPNNGNVVTTAEQAVCSRQGGTCRAYRVDAAGSRRCCGALRRRTGADSAGITSAIEHVRTLELTTAVRDAEMDNLRVRRDILGMLDGKLVIAARMNRR